MHGTLSMNVFTTFFTHPVFLIGAGGAVGSNLRYGIGHLLSQVAIPIPIATTVINILGSLILGCVAGSVSDRTQSTYLLLGVGLCGGFTTFSTFSLELVEQIQGGKIGLALAECVLNVVLGVTALYVGLMFCQYKSQ
jgi:fluoride exporter